MSKLNRVEAQEHQSSRAQNLKSIEAQAFSSLP
jgi:hypothetical protein